jgi:hypothetical protein
MISQRLPLTPALCPRAFHYPQVWDVIEDNPHGIVSSSPGLRACELPWEIVQSASQPQRGCGRAYYPRTQPHWGWLVLPRRTQGSSSLATLGFVPGSLRDSGNFSPELLVMLTPTRERRGLRERGGPSGQLRDFSTPPGSPQFSIHFA